MPSLTPNIIELLPDWWCFRDWHSIHESTVSLSCTLIAKKPISSDAIRCRVNGKLVQFLLTDPPDSSRKNFWFLPDDHISGIEIKYQIPPESLESLLEIETTFDSGLRSFPFIQIHDWNNRHPVPPSTNIERVSGAGATAYNYFCNGASDYLRFSRVAAHHGVDPLSRASRVLDWGAGCARLTRWFIDKGEAEVTGVDVDADNIAWCVENIPRAEFQTVGLYPPTELESKSFDLIFGNSVLTHLTQPTMKLWLAELRSLMKPNGIALLSFHGNFSNAYFCSHSLGAVERILKNGFYDEQIGKEMVGFLSDPTYYRQTFMSDAHALTVFDEAGFEVVDVIVGYVSRCQNLAVLRYKNKS